MNKTAIKNVATFARKELINQVALRAQSFGITPESLGEMEVGSDYVIINGRRYPKSFQEPFKALQREIEKKGFQQVVEEVAYTWFNRFVALRFMEVNDYLPSKIRVLSSQTPGKVDPDILTMYREVDFSCDEAYVQERLQKGDNEAAFRHLLIAQCNQLSQIMPFLFEKINDYTELLLPVPLLHTDSVINRLINEIDEDDFREVEIIGWMYQYYIAEKKDEIFEKLKKNIKIAKEDIPAATQLFTPEWIVKYMVENSLGQLWLESHPESSVKQKMRYYVEPAEQTPEVQAKLDSLKNPYLTPEEITIIDPACGSGHMLVYAFDLLYEIYEEAGYSNREIPYLILERNLYGLEIDDRAAQLASFALMMKARSRSKRVFIKPPTFNILSIKETNCLKYDKIAKLLASGGKEKYEQAYGLLKLFVDAKNYGSLLRPEVFDYAFFEAKVEELLTGQVPELFEVTFDELRFVQHIIRQAKLLSVQYDVVVTNPPYMGVRNMNQKLNGFLEENYPTTKMDLFSAFMEKNDLITRDFGFNVTVTMQSWMFLSSYELYRKNLIQNYSIESLIHMANMVMGIAFGTVATVLRKKFLEIKGTFQYIEISDLDNDIPKTFPVKNKRFKTVSTKIFKDIPGNPIAYWASEKVRDIFRHNRKLGEVSEPKQGLSTTDNNKFLRLWYEIVYKNIGFGFKDRIEAKESKLKWFPYNKAGSYRKWYGNNNYVVNWEHDGLAIHKHNNLPLNYNGAPVRAKSYYFREGITWSLISSSNFGVRYFPSGMLFDVGSHSLFCEINEYYYYASLLNTKIVFQFLKILNPTFNFSSGVIAKLPFVTTSDKNIKSKIEHLAQVNILLSKNDWDSFEISWEFERHPLLTYQNVASFISQAYQNWVDHIEAQFRQLQANEEELNRIFIKIYGLEDELTPEVPDEEITVRRADRERDAKSFLSYAIGCMMGRYSLDVPGLTYAGGEFDWSKYQRFLPDPDGILPITDKSYFEDDIMDRLAEFLKVILGKDSLQENLYWLAESLTIKNNETPVERLRRYFMDEFYKDHLQVYQKRPIYWLFDSGRKKGFRALVYLHRYNPQTLAKMRLDYLQEMQVKYANEEQLLLQRLEQPNLSRAEKTATNKRLEEVRARQRELIDYDKLLADYANQRLDLDLDDGVVVNYAKLQPLLAAIK